NDNELQELPESIGELQDLEMIFLTNNKIKNLPKSIIKLKKLKTLVLLNNPIDNVTIQKLQQQLPGTRIIF
ncbi:MAG TPA: hypothetical protein VF623_01970, partial [Segetibacter sp.]